MPQFESGVYTILPKGVENAPGLGIGPITTLPYPPPDHLVRVVNPPLIFNWIIRKVENNTFTVFAGRGRANDFKWIVKDNVLYISSRNHIPESFRFESAGNGLWKIGLFGKDAILTYNKGSPHEELSFKPADGSDAQLFQAQSIKVPRD